MTSKKESFADFDRSKDTMINATPLVKAEALAKALGAQPVLQKEMTGNVVTNNNLKASIFSAILANNIISLELDDTQEKKVEQVTDMVQRKLGTVEAMVMNTGFAAVSFSSIQAVHLILKWALELPAIELYKAISPQISSIAVKENDNNPCSYDK
jgi:hypothetical protein